MDPFTFLGCSHAVSFLLLFNFIWILFAPVRKASFSMFGYFLRISFLPPHSGSIKCPSPAIGGAIFYPRVSGDEFIVANPACAWCVDYLHDEHQCEWVVFAFVPPQSHANISDLMRIESICRIRALNIRSVSFGKRLTLKNSSATRSRPAETAASKFGVISKTPSR